VDPDPLVPAIPRPPPQHASDRVPAQSPPVRMDQHERAQLRTAAFRSTKIFPGAVGELLSGELLAWDEFGYRLGATGLVRGIVHDVMTAVVEPEHGTPR